MIITVFMALVLVIYGLIFWATANPGFSSYYDIYFLRAPFVASEIDGKIYEGDFWIFISIWISTVSIVAAILLFAVIFLGIRKMINLYLSQIPVYLCMALSIGLYYYTCIRCARCDIEMSWLHKAYIGLFAICIFMIIFCLIAHFISARKNTRSEQHPLYPKMKFIFPALAVLLCAATLLLWYRAYALCKDYESNYGLFEQQDHKLRLDIENNFMGNYQNLAVDTEEGLFYIDHAVIDGNFSTRYYRIMKMDKDGNFTEIYSGEDYKGDFGNLYEFYDIGYADGYLYLSNPNGITRIDPSDGSKEIVILPEENCRICQCVVLDNKIYYLEVGKDNEFIRVSDIHGKDISEPQLFASDLNNPSEEHNQYELLLCYLAGEKLDPHRMYSDEYRYQLYNDNQIYISERSAHGDPEEYLYVCNECIDHVGAVNVYNDKAYYVQFGETGFSVCTYDLISFKRDLISVCDNGRDTRNVGKYPYKIMIGQGKVVVIASFWSYREPDETGEYQYRNGEVRFITPCA